MADFRTKPTDPGYLDPKYRTFTEQWRGEDTRCSSCNKPLWNRWAEMRWRLMPLRWAVGDARRGQWKAAWLHLRQFRPVMFVRGL
jgi:hypothetical protein